MKHNTIEDNLQICIFLRPSLRLRPQLYLSVRDKLANPSSNLLVESAAGTLSVINTGSARAPKTTPNHNTSPKSTTRVAAAGTRSLLLSVQCLYLTTHIVVMYRLTAAKTPTQNAKQPVMYDGRESSLSSSLVKRRRLRRRGREAKATWAPEGRLSKRKRVTSSGT